VSVTRDDSHFALGGVLVCPQVGRFSHLECCFILCFCIP